MKKTLIMPIAAWALFMLTGAVNAQTDVEIDEMYLTDMTFEKEIEVLPDHTKEVWWNVRLANHIYWDDVTIYGDVFSTSPKMYFVENSSDLNGTLYAVREHAMFADLDAGVTTWNWALLTVYEKDLITGIVDSAQNHFSLNSFGYIVPQAYIEVETDDCEAEIEFSSNSDEGGNDNIYLEVKKGAEIYWSKTFSTDYEYFDYTLDIDEPGTYKARMFVWKLSATARDTVKVTFTVDCDGAMLPQNLRATAAPEYSKGIHIECPDARGEIKVFSTNGQLVYAKTVNNREDHIDIEVPGVYIVTYTDIESGITFSQKTVVQ